MTALVHHRRDTTVTPVVDRRAAPGTRPYPAPADRRIQIRAGIRSMLPWLVGLADGACELADSATMTAIIADIIGQEEPDVIVTFGPDGITGHPDHRAVSRWTIGAWRRWPNPELLLATMTDEFLHRNAALHDRIGLSMGSRLRSVPACDLALEVVPSGDEQRRKAQVLSAHASQTTALVDLMGRRAFERWWSHEMFRLPSIDDIVGVGDPAVLVESGAT